VFAGDAAAGRLVVANVDRRGGPLISYLLMGRYVAGAPRPPPHSRDPAGRFQELNFHARICERRVQLASKLHLTTFIDMNMKQGFFPSSINPLQARALGHAPLGGQRFLHFERDLAELPR